MRCIQEVSVLRSNRNSDFHQRHHPSTTSLAIALVDCQIALIRLFFLALKLGINLACHWISTKRATKKKNVGLRPMQGVVSPSSALLNSNSSPFLGEKKCECEMARSFIFFLSGNHYTQHKKKKHTCSLNRRALGRVFANSFGRIT
jgi:hypothetical protein